MIKSLSPYYYSTPFVSVASGLTCDSYTLHLYIWDGLSASVPASATYEITKQNPTASTGSDEINISRIIADYIDFTPQSTTTSEEIDGSNQWWVRTEVTYITTDPTDESTPQYGATELFSRAFSWGNEGKNITTITNNILLTDDEYNIDRTGHFIVPVLQLGGTLNATIISYPDNEINETISEAITTASGRQVQYIWVQLDETTTDTYVEVVFGGQTITILIEDECKYTPLSVAFQNKEGALQFMTFLKEREDSIDITSSEFESDRGQPSDGNHQFVRFNVQAREKFRINTGWIDEDLNSAVKELLMSERIWSFDGTDYTPLNMGTKTITYKTQQKERLINYEIEFSPSYNEINNI